MRPGAFGLAIGRRGRMIQFTKEKGGAHDMDSVGHPGGNAGSARGRLRAGVTDAFQRWTDCVRLNLRVARLGLTGRWVSAADQAASYDRLAPAYNANWLCHLWPVTRALLDRLPAELPDGPALDLGCGTGGATRAILERFPGRPVTAVDLSAGMLAEARRAVPGSAAVRWIQADMLDFLRGEPPESYALIVSAWAMGYSRSTQIAREVARVLQPGGIFAYVVNLRDTLPAVRRAFRQTMARFPQHLRRLAWMRFPSSAATVNTRLQRRGLNILWAETSAVTVFPTRDAAGRCLPWLLNTGILAGFDAMLPLDQAGPVADAFEQFLGADLEPVAHHYAAAVAHKPCSV